MFIIRYSTLCQHYARLNPLEVRKECCTYRYNTHASTTCAFIFSRWLYFLNGIKDPINKSNFHGFTITIQVFFYRKHVSTIPSLFCCIALFLLLLKTCCVYNTILGCFSGQVTFELFRSMTKECCTYCYNTYDFNHALKLLFVSATSHFSVLRFSNMHFYTFSNYKECCITTSLSAQYKILICYVSVTCSGCLKHDLTFDQIKIFCSNLQQSHQ